MQLQISLLLLRMSEHFLGYSYDAPAVFDAAPVFLQLLPTSCAIITSGAMWMIVSSTGAPSGTV